MTELLVVSAVVSVLAGLLLPVLGRAREKARQAVCLGNLRQIGQVALLYGDDFGRLPTSAVDGYVLWNGVGYVTYGRLLPLYGRNLGKSFFCPSSDIYPIDSPATGLQNLGVPNQTTAGSYFARSLTNGAPVVADDGDHALLADVVGNHPAGINALHTDGSAGFVVVPANCDLRSAAAWSRLDRGATTLWP